MSKLWVQEFSERRAGGTWQHAACSGQTPGFPDAVGSMHIPAQVRQHLTGAPVPPQALYPPTSPPPPVLIDQPPLPGQA